MLKVSKILIIFLEQDLQSKYYRIDNLCDLLYYYFSRNTFGYLKLSVLLLLYNNVSTY